MADIASKVAQIRQAGYGKDVRESIASGIEAINTEVESTTAKENLLETTFNGLVINAGSSNAEIVAGRTSQVTGQTSDTLGHRIDGIDSQLADIATLKAHTNSLQRNSYFLADPDTSSIKNYSDRQIVCVGDSHGWGQGGTGYQGATSGYNAHCPWIHNKGFFGRVLDYLMQKYNSQPWRCVPINITALNYGRKKDIPIPDKTYYTVAPYITRGKYEIISFSSSEVWMNAKAKNDTYSDDNYKYNADIGLFTDKILNLAPDIDRENEEYVTCYRWDNMPVDSNWTGLSNKCGEYSNDNKLFSININAPIPSWLTSNAYIYIPEIGRIKLQSIVENPSGINRYNLVFNNTDNPSITPTLFTNSLYSGMKIYRSLLGIAEFYFKIQTPTRYLYITLGHSTTYGAKAKIELLDDKGNEDNLIDIIPNSFGSADYGTAIPTIVNNKNISGNVTINSNNIIIDTGLSNDGITAIYCIDFGQKKCGTVRISHDGASTTGKYDNLNDTIISTRGVLFGNKDMFKNWSFGGHTTGAMLGLEPSYWNETHNHIADILLYTLTQPNAIILEAPIVNEHINQTAIETFKNNLTSICTTLNCNNVIVLVTLGEKDAEFQGNEKAITYDMYCQAVKDWANATGNENVTFLDCRSYLKGLVSNGTVKSYENLYLNNGHPSWFSNETIFNMIKQIIDIKF